MSSQFNFSFNLQPLFNRTASELNTILKLSKSLLRNDRFFASIGILTLLPIAKQLLEGIYYYIRSRSPAEIAHLYKPSLVSGESSWVVVTGATAGIGKAYCRLFAQEGFNIVVVSRTAERLQKLETELLSINPFIKVKRIHIDFVHEYKWEVIREKILNELKHLDISILVNNVGINECVMFHELNSSKIYRFLHVNIYPQVYITKALIAQLNQRSKSRKTAIINISSNFGTSLVFPFFSVYSATKAFNDHFSLTLANEYPEIDILSSTPGRTKSNSTPTGYDTDAQVRETIRFLGLKRRTHGPIDHYFNDMWMTAFYPLIRNSIRKNLFLLYDADVRKTLLHKPDLPVVVQ